MSRGGPAGLVLAILLSACAPADLAFGGPSADQLFSRAIASVERAPAVRVDETFSHASTLYSGTVSVNRHGDVSASASVSGGRVDVLATSGRLWLKADRAYWDAMGRTDALAQKVLAGHWYASPDGALVRDLTEATSASSLSRSLSRTDFVKGGRQTIAGQDTIQIRDPDEGDVYVTSPARGPARLVRIVYAPGFEDSNGNSRLEADFSYPRSLTVSAPSDFYDPADPATLPARFTAESTNRGGCDSSGCAYTVTVRNQAGRLTGRAYLRVTLFTTAGMEIGDCTAAIPAAGFGQTEDVSCSVSGSGWAAFMTGPGALKQWSREVLVHNPVWDD